MSSGNILSGIFFLEVFPEYSLLNISKDNNYYKIVFKGHTNNWTRVLRPEYLEAPNSESIYKSDECLAIND